MNNYAESIHLQPTVEFVFSGIEIRGIVFIKTWDDFNDFNGILNMSPVELDISADDLSNMSHDNFYNI